MAVVLCTSCGYRRRKRIDVPQYGRPAEACPNCNQATYWTDWLDPRGLTALFARKRRETSPFLSAELRD
jgi:hypothetical protein